MNVLLRNVTALQMANQVVGDSSRRNTAPANKIKVILNLFRNAAAFRITNTREVIGVSKLEIGQHLGSDQ